MKKDRIHEGPGPFLNRFKSSMLFLLRVATFILCMACFFGLFGTKYPFLLRASRTTGVVAVSFTVIYVLMTKIYGGVDVGKRKSKPIVFSLALTLLFDDLIVHLLLCIMNTTVMHNGKFVYEYPALLLAVYLLQLLLAFIVAFGGNELYFRVNRPQQCLVIADNHENALRLIQKTNCFRRQYDFQQIALINQTDLLKMVDQAEAVFLCNLSPDQKAYLVEYCFKTKKDLYFEPEVVDVIALTEERIMFSDKTMIRCIAREMCYEERIVKRLGDVLISVLGLLLTSPILLLTALAIWLEDHGPVFYRQARATCNGKTFQVYKFRSMRQQDGHIHISVTKNDSRITKVGRIIRKFRIDELPQLLNVLKGDMSIVGPRPEMVENVKKYTEDFPEFRYRLRVKAGLTGFAQIYGKYNTPPKEKLLMDMTYIQQYSLWLDIKLILRTVLVLLTPEESTEAFEVKDDRRESSAKEQKAGGDY